ncbi:MAG: nitroreductase family protein, partial [Bacillota bacterium]|nr:nitroreductase family protein [Bacillota bacterium]
MTKDVLDAIRERRSIRRFKPSPIPDATLGRLVEAAALAPSAGNLQPWHFCVVKDEAVRRSLARAAGGQSFIAAAPVALVVCADPLRSASRYGRRGAELYCLQDTAAAVQNLLLAATAFGLGSCWVGAFDEELVARALGLPEHLRPVAI